MSLTPPLPSACGDVPLERLTRQTRQRAVSALGTAGTPPPQARCYFTGYLPSSPQIGLLRDGKLVFMLERHDIEGRAPEEIAEDLTGAFDRFCAPAGSAAGSQ